MSNRSDKYCLSRCDLGECYHNDIITTDTFIPFILNHLAPHSNVLDAGAGEGRLCQTFIQSGHRYTGVDAGIGHPAWDFNNVIKLDLEYVDTHFKEQQFDAILLIQVLEHLQSPASILQKLSRILKPNGKLFISVPLGQSCHQIPYDYFRYTPYGIRSLANQAGLHIKQINPQGAGDIESGLRRLRWALDYSKANARNRCLKIALHIAAALLNALNPLARRIDRKSARHIHPLGYVAIIEHA